MEALKIDSLLDESLILLDVTADNWEALLTKIYQLAYDKGYVKDTYLQDLLERERQYPTALPTAVMKVAVPHTIDKSHVIKPAIVIATLKEPVLFKEMGNGVNDVPVDIVFMLAVNGPKGQLEVLQKVISLFTKETAMLELKQARTAKDIIAAVKNNLE